MPLLTALNNKIWRVPNRHLDYTTVFNVTCNDILMHNDTAINANWYSFSSWTIDK